MNIVSRTGDQIVTLDQAKGNSRVTHSAEDALFQLWLDVAHEQVEKEAGLVLQQSICSHDSTGQAFIDLVAPVRGIVSLVDSDGNDVDFTVTKTSSYGCIVKMDTPQDVKVTFIAGFGDYTATGSETAVNEGDIQPYSIARNAVLVLVNHFYENRGVVTDFQKYVLPVGFDRLIGLITKYR